MVELIHDDCMNVMSKYPDKFFELAIVDPPYGIGDFNQEKRAKKPFNRDWEIKWNNSVPGKKYFSELLRVSKNWIVWGANYYNFFSDTGGAIVWVKGNSSDIGSQAEIASTNLFTRVVVCKIQWAGFINVENITGAEKIHPCQKPVKLYAWLLKNYAKPGDKILDTHGGSGSSAIAAHKLGFDMTWIEIDEDYFKAAQKRFKKETAMPLFDNV